MVLNKDRDEIREYPLLLTLDATDKAIAKMLKKKEKYKELREKTIFKYQTQISHSLNTTANAEKNGQEMIGILILTIMF